MIATSLAAHYTPRRDPAIPGRAPARVRAIHLARREPLLSEPDMPPRFVTMICASSGI
jgi:hypothetical protein